MWLLSLVHSMLDFQKATELIEFPVLTFAFCTVVIEWQEQGAIDWHISERGGNILYSLIATQFGEKLNF